MKNLIIKMLLAFLLLLGISSFVQEKTTAQITKVQAALPADGSDIQSAKAKLSGDVQVDFAPETDQTIISKSIIVENWGILSLGLMSFIEIIVRLTPSEKDNSIFNFVSKILNALVPNRRKAGGTF